jgi:predicted exporter
VSEISRLLGDYRYYMGWVVLVSYVAVYALLYPRYRRASWRVLAPTALASLLALALLGIAGQGLQLFHLLAFMLLLGIGVDYGIFMQEPDSQDGALVRGCRLGVEHALAFVCGFEPAPRARSD